MKTIPTARSPHQCGTMAQMFDALTLRNMINFGGPQAEEKLTKLLETLQDAVQ